MDVHVVAVNRMARSPKRYSLNRKANEKHRFSPSNKMKPGASFAEDQRPREYQVTRTASLPLTTIHAVVQDARNMSPNIGILNDRWTGHSTGTQMFPQPVTMPTGFNAAAVAPQNSPVNYGNISTQYNVRQNDFLARTNRAQPTRNSNVYGTMEGYQNATPNSHQFHVKNGARTCAAPCRAQTQFPHYTVPSAPQFYPANHQMHVHHQQFYYGNHHPGNAPQFQSPQCAAAYNPVMENPFGRFNCTTEQMRPLICEGQTESLFVEISRHIDAKKCVKEERRNLVT